MPTNTNSFPCPYGQRVYKSTGPFDKHAHTAHIDLASKLYQPWKRLSKPPSQNEENKNTVVWPELFRALHNSTDIESYEGTRYSDYESDAEELPMSLEGESRIENFEGAGRSFGVVGHDSRYVDNSAELLATPWLPFQNATEFRLAQFFLQSGTSQQSIDSFLKGSLAPAEVDYRSAYTFRAVLDSMKTPLGLESWNCGEVTMAGRRVPFYYRKPLDCIRYLLQQQAYRRALVYGPQRCYEGGERQFGELHMADWWWETQVCLAEPVERS